MASKAKPNEHQQLLTVFKNFPEILYVVDPDTYEVIWVNDHFRSMLGVDPIGKLCHKVIQGLDMPCEFCTNDIIAKQKGKPYNWEHYNKLLDRYFFISDQLIDWPDGREVRFEIAIDITKQKKSEQERNKLVYDMNERLKEMRCIYDISALVETPDFELTSFFREAVKIIARSWQYPDDTCVRIQIDGNEYVTDNFRETRWSQKEDIENENKLIGTVEVFYLKEKPPADEGPFLKEERQLLNALGERFGHIVGRIRAEKELNEHRAQLERKVEERTKELEQELEAGRRREAIIQKQAAEIMELSTPVIQVWEGVVAVPLIGTLDSQRTELFMERFLHQIVTLQAGVALIDITGVPAVDTQTAQHLLEALHAAKLLGAKVILTGISPAIAQTMVHLGIDMQEFESCSTLAVGLQKALEFQKMTIQSLE